MGPQVRQLMQSEHFRSFLTNPDAMQQMMGMMGQGGAGGAGAGAGAGAGGFPPPGAFGWGSGAGAAPGGQAAAPAAPAAGQALFNPWASTPPATGAAATPPAAGTAGAFNPFAPAAGTPDLAQMMAQMQAMQQMGFGGMAGGAPPSATPAGPVVSPEERYQVRCRSTDAHESVELIVYCFTRSTDSACSASRDGILRRRAKRSGANGLGRERGDGCRMAVLQLRIVDGELVLASCCANPLMPMLLWVSSHAGCSFCPRDSGCVSDERGSKPRRQNKPALTFGLAF
jgi:hypothetical protein